MLDFVPPADEAAGPILVVEDDQMIRSALVDCLEVRGFEVLPVESSDNAGRMLDGGLAPPVVVTDVNLGPGRDGLALADQIHRLSPASYVVFITGRPEVLDERGLREREFVLAKPFRPAALMEIVNRLAQPLF